MAVTKWVDVLYDIITIIISIADIVTDVIVLMSFYYKDRSIFFIISLCILCIAQCAYAVAFMWRYDVIYELYNKTESAILAVGSFFILLPFGPIIPIIIFLTSDSDSYFTDYFKRITGFSPDNNFKHYHKSGAAKWMVEKLNKHIGFIIEAGVEAFPRVISLKDRNKKEESKCAIVYYEEANYVSIASILLSMISVMAKSLVFSKGLEIKTFTFTWFCVVVDFFGIFFTLSWVFYSNDTLLVGDFIGYFTFIGEIWFYKILVSVVPCIICMILFWSLYYVWIILGDIADGNCLYNTCVILFWGICVTAAVLLMCAVAFIAIEVFCFTFIAYIVYVTMTKRWTKFESKEVNESIKAMLNFMSSSSRKYGNNDTVIRVMAINYALNKQNSTFAAALMAHLQQIESEQGIGALYKITYSDIRSNHVDESKSTFCEMIQTGSQKAAKELCEDNGNFEDLCGGIWSFLGFFIGGFILFPIFVLSKIFQMLFPYFIIAYLYYENNGSHGLWNKIDTFQLFMLFIYIGLQLVLMLLGIMAFRINFWLWHVSPETNRIQLTTKATKTLINNAQKWYDRVQWYPQIEALVVERFGSDIAQLVLHYIDNIKVESVVLV
eukprot:345925_1